MQQPDPDQMDDLQQGAEQEMQQQEVAMDLMDEGTNDMTDSDESEDSSDEDEFEEPHPLLQHPETVVDAVRAYLPPVPMASLIAERPIIQLNPCDRRADWTMLPDEALRVIYTYLPVSDIHVMGSVFDDNTNAEWVQRWSDEDLVLHDRQIDHGTQKDIKHYIRLHGGVVRSIRIDKFTFTPGNVRSWCKRLRRPEVTGPTELVLVNRGCPSMPLWLMPVPEDILLPFNGEGIQKLHLCFFTLPRGGLHTYAGIAGLRELGLHGCAYNDEDIENGISSWPQLECLTLSFACQSTLRVASHSMRELKLHNSSICILDLREATALVRLSGLDIDSTALKIHHLLIPSLTSLNVVVNYTALPRHSQMRMLRVLLNCFPCVQDLTIKRKDNVTEGQMPEEDNHQYKQYADMDCVKSHLNLLAFLDFRGGKWELVLMKTLVNMAKVLSTLKVVCHDSCSQATRVNAATMLEKYTKNLEISIS